MIKINISGEIGWDIMAFDIEEQLNEANGEDVEVVFNTPGGFISEGNIIDDLILQYKKDFPKSQIMANIIEAQSYGSYLLSNPAFDMIVARTNSIVMIHNPLMGVIGDYKEMKKTADLLERRAAMFAERYSQKMKKNIKEVRLMMDEETYFIGGKEIVESGIADEVITDKESLQDSMSLRAKAETRIDVLKIKIKNSKDDFEKIAAMSKEKMIEDKNKQSTQPATGGENNQEVIKLKNKDELKLEFPEIHTAVMKAGEEKGKEEMKANNKAIMEFKNKDEYKKLEFVQMRCEKAIEDGEDISDLKMSISALMLDPKNQASMESTGDIDVSTKDGKETMSGENPKETKMTAEEIAEKNRVK